MFTGIVEETGIVVAVERSDGGARLRLRGPLVTSDAQVGDSIAVAGVCLTVTELAAPDFSAYAMAETLRRTTIGDLAPGASINLERALPAAGRLGGHIVQGHVDAVARLTRRQAEAGAAWEDFSFALDPGLARYVAIKGSIALDGVSLTVTAADDAGFAVSLIPVTLERTTLGLLRVGDGVNVEVDILAKYVERLLGADQDGRE